MSATADKPPPQAPNRMAYGVAETAQQLCVSKETVWRLVKRGELTTFKIGHRTLIRRQVIDAFLDRKAAA